MKKIFFMLVAIAALSTSSYAYVSCETYSGYVSVTGTMSGGDLHVDLNVIKTGGVCSGGAYFYSGSSLVKSISYSRSSLGWDYPQYHPWLESLSYDNVRVWASAGHQSDLSGSGYSYAGSGLL